MRSIRGAIPLFPRKALPFHFILGRRKLVKEALEEAEGLAVDRKRNLVKGGVEHSYAP